MKSRLDIHSVWRAVHHKVYLQLFSDKLAVLILATKFNLSYVHIISSTAKLIIDNVFHNVCFLLLTIVENGRTYADICEVVFRLGTNIFSVFHIIAQGFLYQERVFQIVNVLFYSVSFYISVPRKPKGL